LIKGNQGKRSIRIFNSGKCAARNIHFKILQENQNFLILNENIFPFELLNPQESTELTMIISEGSLDKIKIHFIWEDNNDLINSYERVLTL